MKVAYPCTILQNPVVPPLFFPAFVAEGVFIIIYLGDLGNDTEDGLTGYRLPVS